MRTDTAYKVGRKFWAERVAVIAVAAVLLAGEPPRTRSQVAPDVRDKEVMKFKLHYAQGVLEAIATENYPLLATNAQKLTQLSRQASWKLRQTPQYETLTGDFRRGTEALAKAAKDQNVDAATVAYFQMTVACVTCHKYLRGRDVVLGPPPSDLRAWQSEKLGKRGPTLAKNGKVLPTLWND